MADNAGHGIEGRFRRLVEFSEQGRGFGGHGEGAEDLPRMFEELSGDLGGDHVARPYLAVGSGLARHAILRVCHRRDEEIADVGHAAVPEISRLRYGAELT